MVETSPSCSGSTAAPFQPSPQEVLALERQSRQAGSGISNPALIGSWRPALLWSCRKSAPQPVLSALLQLFQARLNVALEQDGTLRVENQVAVPPMQLKFVGRGQLNGRRPLLRFGFGQVELKLGRWQLMKRDLPQANLREQPFFALIAQGEDRDGRWLLARGRGGGLACWRCP